MEVYNDTKTDQPTIDLPNPTTWFGCRSPNTNRPNGTWNSSRGYAVIPTTELTDQL